MRAMTFRNAWKPRQPIIECCSLKTRIGASKAHYLDTRGLDRDRERERESERQTDRQTARQADRQIDRQTGRETERPTDRQTDKETDRQTDRQTERERERFFLHHPPANPLKSYLVRSLASAGVSEAQDLSK